MYRFTITLTDGTVKTVEADSFSGAVASLLPGDPSDIVSVVRMPSAPTRCAAVGMSEEQIDAGVVEPRDKECEKLRKDAERYRWLRRGGNDEIGVVRGFDGIDCGSTSVAYTYEEGLCGEYLDDAIDAAMDIRQDQGAPACEWEEDDDDGNYETACGNRFCIIEGSPTNNRMRYCCYCGGRLAVAAPAQDSDDKGAKS